MPGCCNLMMIFTDRSLPDAVKPSTRMSMRTPKTTTVAWTSTVTTRWGSLAAWDQPSTTWSASFSYSNVAAMGVDTRVQNKVPTPCL